MGPDEHDTSTPGPAASASTTPADRGVPAPPPASDAPDVVVTEAVPSWMARAWIVAGTVGVVASLVGAVVGVVFVRSLATTSTEALELSETVLATVDDTAVLLDDAFTDVATTLDTVSATVGETTATMDEVSTTLDDLTMLVTEDVPASLDAVGDAMPQLVRTAGVIDSTMRALRFVGVDYDPAAPLDESLQEVDDRLAEIAPSLRDQREGLESVGTRLDTLGEQGATLADDVTAINDDLDATRALVDEFRGAAGQAATLTGDLADRLAWQSTLAQVALVVLALALAVTQTVPIMLGLRMLGRDTPWTSRRRNDPDDQVA